MGLLQDQNISRDHSGASGTKRRSSAGSADAGGTRRNAAKASGGNGPETSEGAAGTGERHLRQLVASFNAVLGRCAASAGVAEVHRVRTRSRRVQATVETMVREAGAQGKALEKPARAWLREMKNLRRAAGPVRDLDVHRQMLGKMLERAAAEAKRNQDGVRKQDGVPNQGGVPNQDGVPRGAAADPLSPDLESGGGAASAKGVDLVAGQARALDKWLDDKRHDKAEVLARKIRKGREKLARRQAAFFAAAEHVRALQVRVPSSASVVALEDFVRATEAMPLLNTGNLHEFRKLTKKARYVADAGGADPAAAAVARALKRIQDAIGEWHDWLGLTEEAKIALREDAPQLAVWLEDRLDRSLIRALRVTGQMRGRLLGEWRASGSRTRRRAPRARRRPPSRAASDEIGKNAIAPAINL